MRYYKLKKYFDGDFMKKIVLFILIVGCLDVFSQFDIEKYKEYLNTHKEMTYEELIKEYPAGFFNDKAPSDFLNSEYGKEISEKFNISDYEKQLINTNGFMVTDRLKYPTFIHALWDIFKKDMPVYISTDAIFQALHYSYDKILVEIEEEVLYEHLSDGLSKLKTELKLINLADKNEKFKQAALDVDVYVSIAEKLLNGKTTPIYEENKIIIDEILKYIQEETYIETKIFSNSFKGFDFSQFTPRGHYTQNAKLSKYFQSLMWLGRTELMITNPQFTIKFKQTDEDLQRMALMTSLIAELAKKSTATIEFDIIEQVMEILIGRQDNISLNEVIEILDKSSLNTEAICDTLNWKKFQNKLIELSSSNQLYNSQVLFTSPMAPSIVTPSVFLLIGQRPIIDGFITANVVFDKVIWNNEKIKRMVPSTLDILFSMGNDACIQLMEDEITKYKYASNLGALRYLINSYDDEFWKGTLYNNWLNSIRVLNPPEKRKHLPLFMQTAAWWQKTMNTQLAAWAQLRYNFVLYAKQPYTSSLVCSFPEAYIEPVPEFYNNLGYFWKNLKKLKQIPNLKNPYALRWISEFCDHWIATLNTLENLADKTLNNIAFDNKDQNFVCSTLKPGKICDAFAKPEDFGWYLRLYYDMDPSILTYRYLEAEKENYLDNDQMIVTDVHTIPTDENANLVGWVLHAGTGTVNLSVITTPTPDGKTRSYIGPVFSYYEFISNDFKRLTNEEWRNMDGEKPYRPKFTNLYLANSDGKKPEGEKVSLKTIILNVDEQTKEDTDINLSCSPNPFNNLTMIKFNIDADLADLDSEITIFDLEGKIVKNIFKGKLSSNSYSLIWDGTDNNKNQVNSGTYIGTVKIAEKIYSTKINLRK